MNKEQKENVRVYFDDTGSDYNRVYDIKDTDSLRAYIFLSRKRKILELLGKHDGRVLDIGCGPGVFTEELLKSGCEIWGIDVSEHMIKQAKDKIKEKKDSERAHFSVGDIEKLDFPDNYFDFVLCVGVLEYLSDDSLALKEVHRVLKAGGEAIFTVPNLLSPFSLIDKTVIFTIKAIHNVLNVFKIKVNKNKDSLLFNSSIKDKYYSPLRFNKKLSKSGFKINRKVFHIYRLSVLNVISRSFSLSFARNLEGLSKSPFYWMGINYIVKTQKS